MSQKNKRHESSTGVWPKPVVELTEAEASLKEQVCLEFQQWGYSGILGWAQAQGHKAVENMALARSVADDFFRSLEIGCGSGYHFRHTNGKGYYGLDHSFAQLQQARVHFPDCRILQGDVYQLPFPDSSFDRVISIYLFEHLNRLPDSLAEVRRVMKPGAELLVALPSEGGLAYEWGRYLTSKRHFERKYKVDYLKFVRSEHCNTCNEVIEELRKWFVVECVRHLPFRIPTVHLNATVALRCVNKRGEAAR